MQVSVRPEFPNILIVSGVDVYRPDTMVGLTRNLLEGGASALVGRGTHEFWIIQPLPHFGGTSSFTSADDGASGHRRRGVIEMYQKLSGDEATLTSYLSTLLQEVGHHWLSPSDMKIRGQRTSSWVELTEAINQDMPFRFPPLIARDDAHWSAYWKSDGSPMDGLCFRQIGSEDGREVWTTTSACAQEITLPAPELDPGLSARGKTKASSAALGGPDIFSGPRVQGYNDLDLYIMGVKSAEQSYDGRAGVVWMRPQVTHNVESHAGVTVVFTNKDHLMFGFDGSDRKLSLRDSTGQVLGSADISPNYRPLASIRNGVMLRVVRRGNNYYFQARTASAGGFWDRLFGNPLPRAWDNLEPPNHIDTHRDFRRWRTVATATRSTAPRAIGTFVNRWSRAHLTDASFYRFEIKEADGWSTNLATDASYDTIERAAYGGLSRTKLMFEDARGAWLRSRLGRLHIITPYAEVVNGRHAWFANETFQYKLSSAGDLTDNAPRLLARAPVGNFAFVTHARLDRTIVTPQAGGYAKDKPVFGFTRRVAARDITLSGASKKRQNHPADKTYRMAFIAVTPDAATLSLDELQKLDGARRYWEACFEIATDGGLKADTTL